MSKYQVDQEGTFQGVVTEPIYGWLGASKNGTVFIRVPVTIATEGEQKGKTIDWYGYLSERASERTIEILESCFGTDWDWSSINWTNTPVEIVVEADEYNGKTSYKAKWLNNPSADRTTGNKSPEEIELLKVEAKTKSKIIAKELAASMPRRAGLPIPAPTKPVAAPKPASRPLPTLHIAKADDEEIPF